MHKDYHAATDPLYLSLRKKYLQSLRSENAMAKDPYTLLDNATFEAAKRREELEKKSEQKVSFTSTGDVCLDMVLEQEAKLKSDAAEAKAARETEKLVVDGSHRYKINKANNLPNTLAGRLTKQSMDRQTEAYEKEKARKAQVDKDLDEIF